VHGLRQGCPHDNIGLFAVAPVRDVLRDPVRSSIGRFSSRIDIAALVLVVVVAAFVNAGLMVVPAAFGKYLALVVALAAVATALLVAANPSKGNSFARFSQALLPWGWPCGLPSAVSSVQRLGNAAAALHQAGTDFGGASAGACSMGKRTAPAARQCSALRTAFAAGCRLATDAVPGWRLAQQWSASAGRAVLLLLPWASMVTLGYAAGVWVLLQPMQMRGVIMNP